MWKPVIGVISGFLLWSFLWIGGNQLLGAVLPEHFRLDEARSPGAGALSVLIVYSLVCSFASGALTNWMGRGAMWAVWTLGLVLLAVGIAVEASYWQQLPLWYHIIFLVLLVPLTAAGAMLTSTLTRNRQA